MLDELHASNIGLIQDAVITPGPGLTIITGETGTGKTLMLGALRLVRGDAASRDIVGPHAETAEVAGRLLADDGTETVVRRTVGNGRSRAYVDGVPVTAGELTRTIGQVVSIVSQHDQHTLTTSEGVRGIVDAMFEPEDTAIYADYQTAYRALDAILDEMEALGSDQRGLERERDVLRFQLAEITTAGFVPGEEEALRAQLDRLRHVEELSAEVALAINVLGDRDGDGGVEDHLATAIGAVERISRLDAVAEAMASELSDVASRLRECRLALVDYGGALDVAPGELADAEARLAELSGLKRKYGDTIADIDRFAKDAGARLEQIDLLIDAASDIEVRHLDARETLEASALELRRARERHAGVASRLAHRHLEDLGFVDPVVRIEVSEKEPTATGADRLRVLFASDSALEPAPISSVASGGELSRLVLALTLASGRAASAVVAFDEIDAGIGGSTALAMGEKLSALAATRQVICVTHLPQVAAFGGVHFVVSRTGTSTKIVEVTGDARVEEISRMLAGLSDSEKGKGHATELLALARDASPVR